MTSLTPMCPYCGEFSRKVDGAAIYPYRLDLAMLVFYQCSPCRAYVGTHKGTDRPLGRLADKALRDWKSLAHEAFDPVWKQQGFHRKKAYAALAKAMHLSPEDCHIGMFDVAQCRQAVDLCLSGELYRSL